MLTPGCRGRAYQQRVPFETPHSRVRSLAGRRQGLLACALSGPSPVSLQRRLSHGPHCRSLLNPSPSQRSLPHLACAIAVDQQRMPTNRFSQGLQEGCCGRSCMGVRLRSGGRVEVEQVETERLLGSDCLCKGPGAGAGYELLLQPGEDRGDACGPPGQGWEPGLGAAPD